MATVIVGVGVVGTMSLLAACTAQNRGGARMTTAIYLAQCTQEMLADLPFNDPSGAGFGREEGGGILTWNDIDDFHGWDSSADGGRPLDARRQVLTGLDAYTQTVTVTEVSPTNLSLALPGADCKQVTVRVLYRERVGGPQQEVYRTSWIRTR